VYAFACIYMLAAVLMVTVMQTNPKGPRTPDDASTSSGRSNEESQVGIPVCGGMHVDA
jgi:hypothetical protein